MRLLAPMLAVTLLGVLSSAQSPSVRTFDTYVIDVEGGEATLFVLVARFDAGSAEFQFVLNQHGSSGRFADAAGT